MIQRLYNSYISLGLSQHLTSIATSITALIFIVIVGILLHKMLNKIFFKQFKKFINRRYPKIGEVIEKSSLFRRFLMFIVPLVLMLDISIFLGTPEEKELHSVVSSIEKMLSSYVLLLLGIFIASIINAVEYVYNKYSTEKSWPIRSFAQFFKTIVFIIFTIIITSNLLNKSPAAFFTGLGAATAVIMLVFKDSILSFVASIQLASSRMMKVGDWIEISGKDISGTITEMSLNTVKVQNFDKTISTVPPYYLTSNIVKNWQGMFDFGARRIKKNFIIDADTIVFLDEKKITQLESSIPLLSAHIKKNKKRLLESQVTNLTLFRHYAESFLEKDNRFSKEGVVFMVRMTQQPYVGGIPLEVYAYTKDTNWKTHEHIQAEFIEIFIASLPRFGLKLLQHS